MASSKRYLAARIPEHLYNGLSQKAKDRGVSITDAVIEALEKYLGNDLPGLCPSCQTQNLPDAQYCQKCGEPLTETAKQARNLLDKVKLEPEFIRELSKSAGINLFEGDDTQNIAMNNILKLVKQIDELQPIVEWAKKKMDEEKIIS